MAPDDRLHRRVARQFSDGRLREAEPAVLVGEVVPDVVEGRSRPVVGLVFAYDVFDWYLVNNIGLAASLTNS